MSENVIFFNSPAENFEEALPLGNGFLGAMVYGKTDTEKISLNLDTLWSGKPLSKPNKPSFEKFYKARQLVLNGEKAEAQEIIENEINGGRTNSYLPMGTMFLNFNSDDTKDYKRMLDISKAVASVSYGTKNKVQRDTFISYEDKCLVSKINSEQEISFEICVESLLKSNVRTENDLLVLDGICPDVFSYFSEPEHIEYNGFGVPFTILIKVVSNGNVCLYNNKITVKNATESVVLLTAESGFVSYDKKPTKNHFEICKKRINDAILIGATKLLKRHIEDYSALYKRVSLDLKGNVNNNPTDYRLQNSKDDFGLYELLFNFGRYLLISSSRPNTQAANLQGIWNEKLHAPWGANYTTNINLEMNYWPTLCCNMTELNEPLFSLIKKVASTGKETAKSLYNADGFVLHHNTDLWGFNEPVDKNKKGSCEYSFWNVGGAWLLAQMFNYYEYTKDEDFLRNTAYPIMKESAKFFMCILIEDDGRLILSPSTSPENTYYKNKARYAIAKYSTMTQTIIKELFENCIKACDILSVDLDFKKKLIEVSEKLMLFKIGKSGQLLEWDEEYEETDIHHRHTSHLYGIYPGKLITKSKYPKVFEACKKSLEMRGDDSTGWSLAWKIALWANLKDGNKAFEILQRQVRFVAGTDKISLVGGGFYPNLFCAHPPFQIDGNFGVTAAITQFFMQYEDDKIKILPALPDKMEEGEVKGLLTKGNICVDIKWKNKMATNVSFVSPFKQQINVLVNEKSCLIDLEPNISKNIIL